MSPTDPKLSSGSVASSVAKTSEGDRPSQGWAKDSALGAGAPVAVDGAVAAEPKRTMGRKKAFKTEQEERDEASAAAASANGGGTQPNEVMPSGAASGEPAPDRVAGMETQADRPASVARATDGNDRPAAAWAREDASSHDGNGSLYALLGGGLALGAGVGAGGGGGGNSGANLDPANLSSTVHVVAQDGPISGANVSFDLNDNKIVEAGEKQGTTNAAGQVTVTGTEVAHDVVVTGGMNANGIPNGLEMRTHLASNHDGVVVVNPLTTLVAAAYAVFEAAQDVSDPEWAVKQAFGLTSVPSLSEFDPLESANATLEAATILKVSAQLATIASDASLASSAFAKIAQYISAHQGSVIDLSNTATLRSIFSGASASALSEIDDVASNNAAIEDAVSGVDTEGQSATQYIAGVLAAVEQQQLDGAAPQIELASDNSLNVIGRNLKSNVVIEYSQDGGKTWSAQLAKPSSGSISVVARAHLVYDDGSSAGWSSGNSNEVTFTLDSTTPTRPAAPTVELAHDSMGASATDHITNDATLNTGDVVANTKLQYSLDHKSWTQEIGSLADGAYDVYVRRVDLSTGKTSVEAKLNFTLDTVSHAGSLTLAANTDELANDTGYEDTDIQAVKDATRSDGITGYQTPVLAGQTEAGAISVKIQLAGHDYTVDSADLHEDGSWTWHVPVTLLDGIYTPVVTVVDAAGNVSEPTPMGTFVVDTKAPEPGTGAITFSSDTGESRLDSITSQTQPTLAGTAEAGARVLVDVGDDHYDTVADAHGHWSVSITKPLADDSYTPSVYIVDGAGNVNSDTEFNSFTIDTVAPIQDVDGAMVHEEELDTGISSDDGVTSNSQPMLAGTTELGTAVTIHISGVTIDGDPIESRTATFVAVDGDWTYTFDEPLDDGVYTTEFTYTDLAGNVTYAQGDPIVIDTQAPDGADGDLVHDAVNDTGSDDSDGVTSNNHPIFTGTAGPGETVQLEIDGTVYLGVADADGNWSIEATDLSDGEYTPLISVVDLAGNLSDVVEGSTLIIDTSVEDVAGGLAQDEDNDTGVASDDGITSNNAPTLQGTAEAGAEVSVLVGGQVLLTTADEDGAWSVAVDAALADGVYTPVLTVTDLAGNVIKADGSPFEIDTKEPEATGLSGGLSADDENDTGSSHSDGLTNNSSPTISGLAHSGDMVLVEVDGTVYDTTADDSGRWSVTVDSLSDGEYTPLISLVDLAGNVSEPIEGKTFVIDTEGPSEAGGDLVHDASNDTGVDQEDNITNNARPWLEGTADAGSVVTITLGDDIYHATADVDGNWSVHVSNDLPDGEYTPIFEVADEVGNVTSTEGATIVIDTEGSTSDEVTAGLTPDEENDTGLYQDDGITNNNAPLLSGTADPLVNVRVTIGHAVYDTQADDDGAWSVQIDPLGDGEYTPEITVTDTAGNLSDPIEGTPFTIDTHGPTSFGLTGGLTPDEDNDTGALSDDGITSNNAPSLTGSADAGAVVMVDVDGTIYQTEADDDGIWTVQLEELPDGEYTPGIAVTDLAGNAGEFLDGTPFTIDTEAPDAADGGLLHDPVNDSGIDSEDGITNNNTPVFAGTAAPDALINVVIDGQVFETVADGDGNWTLMVDSSLDDGVYTPIIQTIDEAGNITEIEAAQITIDTTAPTDSDVMGGLTADEDNDTGLLQDDGITNNSAPIISGTAEALSLISVELDGANYETQADEDGAWSVAVEGLADGEYTPLITATDAAGNQSEPIEGATFTVDTQAPADVSAEIAHELDIDTGEDWNDGITNNASPLLTGDTEAGATVSVELDGNVFETQADDTGYWELTAEGLSDGEHTPVITVTDLAGNVSEPMEGVPFTVDTEAPEPGTGDLVHTSWNDTGVDSEDGITVGVDPLFEGTAGAGDTVRLDLNGQVFDTQADADGNWSIQLLGQLEDGDYTPVIQTVDLAGNVTEVEGNPITIDHTAPTADEVVGGLTADEENDTGVSSEDGITNNNAPTVSGVCEALALVMVEVGGATYDAQADEDGNWSVALDMLEDGEYTPLITVVDVAGNISDPIEGTPFTIDTASFAPLGMYAALTPEEDNDTGIYQDDGLTNNNAPTLTGETDPLALLKIDVDGTIYETQADEDGSWTVALDTLADGEYTPLITVTDAAGNESDPFEGTPFTIDTEGPDGGSGSLVHDDVNDTGLDVEDGLTANNLPVLSGSADAGARIQLDLNGTVFEAQADDAGEWTLAVDQPLDDGEYTPVLSVFDDAGNATETELDPFVIDTQGPTADEVSGGLLAEEENDTGAASDDGLTNNSAPSLSGVVDALSMVMVEVGGQEYVTQADEDGNWTVTLDTLADGEYTPVITATDAAGNVGEPVEGTPFTIDTQGPSEATAELVHDEDSDTGASSDDGLTNNTSPTISGTAEPLSTVSVDLNGDVFEAVCDDDGNWLVTVEGLADGEYTPLITVTDLAGNAGDVIEGVPFVIDTQGPDEAMGDLVHDDVSDTGIAADDGITANNTPSFEGTSEPGAMIRLDIGGLVFETQADDAGAWSLDVDASIPDGEYVPVITTVDAAGNETQSEAPTIIIDTTAPTAQSVTGGLTADEDNDTGLKSNDGITNNAAPTLSGVADALAVVTVEVDGSIYQTQADEDGQWTVAVDELSDGDYVPMISVTDAAGNESAPVAGKGFTIDTEGPTEVTGGLLHNAINDTGAAADDGYTRNTQPTLAGTADIGAIVVVDIDSRIYQTVTDAAGNWSLRVPDKLADGEYTPVISVTDVAGNSSDEIEGELIVVDTAVAGTTGGLTHDSDNDTGVFDNDGVTNNNLPSLSGTAEANATVSVKINEATYETTADESGLWTVAVENALADGTYVPQITVTDLAGNTATTSGDHFTIDTVASGGGIGSHFTALVGDKVNLNPLGANSSFEGNTLEDYSGNLPEGLSIDPVTHQITGVATAAGATWMVMGQSDLAGNVSTTYFQFAVTTAEKTAVTINSPDPEKISTYLGSDGAEHMNIYSSTGDVLLAGAGDDKFQLFNIRAESPSPSLGFARIDGGAGIDLVTIYGANLELDFSQFNNPDGANADGVGWVMEHIEAVQFSDKGTTLSISAGDVFHMKSDMFDVDGVHQMVRIMANSSNGGEVTLDGLTQVGSAGEFGASGGASNGKSTDKYTKFYGNYQDESGDHLVALLLQNGLHAA